MNLYNIPPDVLNKSDNYKHYLEAFETPTGNEISFYIDCLKQSLPYCLFHACYWLGRIHKIERSEK